MYRVDLTAFEFAHDRAQLRRQVIEIFLNEEPGRGRRDLTARYQYLIRKYTNDRELILVRPARFNNGFDFTINVMGLNFNEGVYNSRVTKRPSHAHIINDLKLKRVEDPENYSILVKKIDAIYSCKAVDKNEMKFKSGIDPIILLDCIYWLFVEQDVTYWNYSGRHMLYSKICEIE